MSKRINNPGPSTDGRSHEFHTPLRVVKELVDLMHTGQAGPLNTRQSEYLGMAADRIDEMLEASKIASGAMAVWRRKSTPRKIIDAAYGALQRKTAAESALLEISLDENLPEVFCDIEMIGRAIVKLMGCAVACSSGRGRVVLRAESDEEAFGVRFSIEIINHGNNSAEKTPEKLGSGLSTVRELVRLNFGEMGVLSRAEGGTTFSFTIPRWNPRELADRFIADLDRWRQPGASAALAAIELKPVPKPEISNLADGFLQRIFRSTDLVLPISPAKWLVAAVGSERETDGVFRRVENAWAEIAENRSAEGLPKIGFRARGAWDLETGVDEFAGCLHAELKTGEWKPEAPRVLVVEDDRELLEGLELRLHAAGYDVFTATDGRSAIDSAIEHRPNAILMDNYMPGMDGIRAMGYLGKLPDTKDIPIIMISANVRDQQKALRQGARFFLQKPCSATTIVAALDNVIKEPAP